MYRFSKATPKKVDAEAYRACCVVRTQLLRSELAQAIEESIVLRNIHASDVEVISRHSTRGDELASQYTLVRRLCLTPVVQRCHPSIAFRRVVDR